MKRLTFAMKSTKCTLIWGLLAVASTSALANDGTQGSMNKPTKGEPWAITKAPCHELISRYIDWHSIAAALGRETADNEYQWLKETGLLNEEDASTFHKTYAKPEQQIASFESVAASCIGNPLSDQFRGELIINSILLNGEPMTRTFFQKGPDAYSITEQSSGSSGVEFSALPQTYLFQLPFTKEYYQRRIDELNIFDPNTLKFTEDVVDLWFDWPTDILMTSVKDMSIEASRNGRLNNFSINTAYKTALTQSDAGVRLSSQYVGLPTITPPHSEEDVKEANQAHTTRCIESMGVCWQFTFPTLPYHFVLDEMGKVSLPIVDDLYLAELKKLLRAQYGSTDNHEEFSAKMIEQVKLESRDTSPSYLHQPLEKDLNVLHGNTLENGKTYTEYAAPINFTSRYNRNRDFQLEGNETSLKYLGKKPCSANDKEKTCAHIEYIFGNKNSKNAAIVVYLKIDILLEPHSLLMHKIDYGYFKTEFTSEDQSIVKSSFNEKYAIRNSYEDLPK